MASSTASILSRLVPSGSLVLDIGCGTGRIALGLSTAGYRVVAMDMDHDAVSTGRELAQAAGAAGVGKGPLFLAARAEAPPFRPRSFSAVACFDVLHWAADTAAFEAVWRGAWDALEPGGRFLVRTLLRDRIPSAAPLDDGRHRLESGAVWFLPTVAAVGALLAEAGAEAPDIRPDGPEGSALILSRKPG